MDKLEKLKKLVSDRQKTGSLITIRELARKLRVRQKDAVQMAEDVSYMVNIGFRVPGGGYFHGKIGDWTVETE